MADIIRRHAADYIEARGGSITRAERRVLVALASCRTAALGGHRAACPQCGHSEVAYNSCRNRHCPKCQGAARAKWLDARRQELLPVQYFHVVFTLPHAIAPLALCNKSLVYGLLFRAAWETLRELAGDAKHLGAKIGLLAVLHTWGRRLEHHPHLHCVVPGGGLAPDGSRWIACRPGFFVPVRPRRRDGGCWRRPVRGDDRAATGTARATGTACVPALWPGAAATDRTLAAAHARPVARPLTGLEHLMNRSDMARFRSRDRGRLGPVRPACAPPAGWSEFRPAWPGFSRACPGFHRVIAVARRRRRPDSALEMRCGLAVQSHSEIRAVIGRP